MAATLSVHNMQLRNIGRAKCIVCPTNRPLLQLVGQLPHQLLYLPISSRARRQVAKCGMKTRGERGSGAEPPAESKGRFLVRGSGAKLPGAENLSAFGIWMHNGDSSKFASFSRNRIYIGTVLPACTCHVMLFVIRL